MEKQNRCFFLDTDHAFEKRYEAIPKVGECDVLIKIHANGICGSDVHFYKDGRLGNFIVKEPYIPGHEASGEVVELGSDVDSIHRGDKVVIEPGIPCGKCENCRSGRYNLCEKVIFLSAPPINGTFCDYISVPVDAVHVVPQDLSYKESALIEPAAVAIHAVNRVNDCKGKTAVILGTGAIGLLTIQAFKIAGGKKVIAVDTLETRLEFAKKIGADEVINIGLEDKFLQNLADIVFETAGADKATESLFTIVKTGGAVVQVGWPKSNLVKMHISNFIEKELVYYGVNRYANCFPTAIGWLADSRLNLKELITHEFDFEKLEEAFKYIVNNQKEVIKVVVTN